MIQAASKEERGENLPKFTTDWIIVRRIYKNRIDMIGCDFLSSMMFVPFGVILRLT